MKNIDYDYIAENMSELAYIPIRIYKNDQFVKFYSPIPFDIDPATLYIDKLLSIEKKISYYITPYYEYYGIVHHMEYTLILGPTFQIPITKQNAREMMFLLGVEKSKRENYQSMLQRITPMPLQLFLHFLCLLNFYLSDEKHNVSDILLFDSSSDISLQEMQSSEELPSNYENDTSYEPAHTSYDLERKLYGYIRNGDPQGLSEFFSYASPGQAGKIGDTYIRQSKNIFIVSATLASRAAIEGGLPVEEALTLSDEYIRHSEKYNAAEPINNLQYHMILDYATQVHDLNHGKNYSKVIRDAISYIRDHLTENIRIERLAEVAFLSRSQLSVRFREETGMTITEYIRLQKIKKAQEFLTSTDKTPIEISTYLGFSSQSHFQKVFKDVTGMTPKEYREK